MPQVSLSSLLIITISDSHFHESWKCRDLHIPLISRSSLTSTSPSSPDHPSHERKCDFWIREDWLSADGRLKAPDHSPHLTKDWEPGAGAHHVMQMAHCIILLQKMFTLQFRSSECRRERKLVKCLMSLYYCEALKLDSHNITAPMHLINFINVEPWSMINESQYFFLSLISFEIS